MICSEGMQLMLEFVDCRRLEMWVGVESVCGLRCQLLRLV